MNKQNKTPERLHFMHFALAGFPFWEGPIVFNELKVGTKLTLCAEPENKHDALAIAIYYGDTKIGYVPKDLNEQFEIFFELGYEDIFEACINRIVPEAAQPIYITVYLKRNK